MLHLHRSTERRFDAIDAATARRFDAVEAALARLNKAMGTHGERIARLDGPAGAHEGAPA